MAAVTFSGMAQNVGDVFYIYRNDGHINGFIASEVQSLAYSYEDEDGNLYDEIVTQIVTTADSVYKIPLAVIDSVSFVTPKTEYQPDAIVISNELMSYVESCDGMTIVLSSSTPSSLIPKVGDKLVTVEMNDKFPIGFAGKVVKVSGKEVTCEAVNLEDVLKQFCYVSSTFGVQNSSAPYYAPQKLDGIDHYNNSTFTVPTLPYTGGTEFSAKILDSDVAVKRGNEYSMKISPTFHVIFTLIVNEVQGTYINACISSEITLEEEFSIYGGLEWTNEPLSEEITLATVAPFTKLYIKPGIFIRAELLATLKAKWQQKFLIAGSFDYSTKGGQLVKPSCGGRMLSADFDVEGSFDGKISGGDFCEFGLTFGTSNIDKLCFRGELGAELVAHAVLFNSDIMSASKETKVYERFKNSKIESNLVFSTSLQAEFGPTNISQSLPVQLSGNIKSWDIVPKFKDVKIWRTEDVTCAESDMIISGNLAFPVWAGLSLYTKEGDYVDHVTDCYVNPNLGPKYEEEFNLSFIVETDKDYVLYPMIKFFDYDMLASPTAELSSIPDLSCSDANHPHMVDLGLPSGTLWSCCNVGSYTPASQGYRFAWGETYDKSYCSWDRYQYGYYNNDHDYSQLVDIGSDIQGTPYDAAQANWGGSWVMPTKTQFDELISYCSSYMINRGRPGCEFVGPNGNAIFFPADGEQYSGVTFDYDKMCCYWTSTLYEAEPYLAWAFFAWPSHRDNGVNPRALGNSVRPVINKK